MDICRESCAEADESEHLIFSQGRLSTPDPKRVLERATANCAKHYAKGKVSFELLALVDPVLVEAACPHAKALLDRLRTLLR